MDLRNVWVGDVTAIQPLYMGGKIVSGYKMAGMAERLQHELKQTATTEVESKVDETYWQVVSLASKEKLISYCGGYGYKSRWPYDTHQTQ